MIDDMVMRSVYLTQTQNDQLSDMVERLKTEGISASKSDLVRTIIASCLAEGYFNSGRYYADARFQGYEGKTDKTGEEVRSDRLLHPGLAATLSRCVPKRSSRLKALTA